MTNTITNKGNINALHIEDAMAVDDTSDTSGVGGAPKTKKVNPDQIRGFSNVGYGIQLQNFQSKLAQVKKGTLSKVRIFCLGDSTTAGRGAGGGDAWGNSWPAALTQLFNKAGFNATNAAFYNSGDGTNGTSVYNSLRLTIGSSWTAAAIPSLGGNVYQATTTTNALSFKPTEIWDTAVVSYLTASSQGTFSTDIDGAGTINTNGNGSNGNARFTTTTATPGIHTVNFKYVSGTTAFIGGVECYNSQLPQVMIVNCGWGGVTTATMAAYNPSFPFNARNALEFQAPDLTIFGTVINDWLQTQDLAALATNAAALITSARLSGDCIWMLSVPSSIANKALAFQQSYCDVIRAVCIANNVPIVDMFDRFQSFEISNLLSIYSDSIHPNGPGYEMIANAVFNALNVKGASTNIQANIAGTTAKAGCVGEVLTSSVAIGSAGSLSSGTAGNITSILLQPGDYDLWGNIGFIAATGTIPTIITGSISSTSGTQATSPNGGAYAQVAATMGTSATQILPVGTMQVNPTVPTTYYLVGTATFTVSTLTAYGSISARRRT